MNSFKKGEKIVLKNKNLKGRIAYVGLTNFSKEPLCGVILDEPKGLHNGTINETTYFSCKKNHGLFATLEHIQKDSEISTPENTLKQPKLKTRTFLKPSIAKHLKCHFGNSKKTLHHSEEMSKTRTVPINDVGKIKRTTSCVVKIAKRKQEPEPITFNSKIPKKVSTSAHQVKQLTTELKRRELQIESVKYFLEKVQSNFSILKKSNDNHQTSRKWLEIWIEEFVDLFVQKLQLILNDSGPQEQAASKDKYKEDHLSISTKLIAIEKQNDMVIEIMLSLKKLLSKDLDCAGESRNNFELDDYDYQIASNELQIKAVSSYGDITDSCHKSSNDLNDNIQVDACEKLISSPVSHSSKFDESSCHSLKLESRTIPKTAFQKKVKLRKLVKSKATKKLS